MLASCLPRSVAASFVRELVLIGLSEFASWLWYILFYFYFVLFQKIIFLRVFLYLHAFVF